MRVCEGRSIYFKTHPHLRLDRVCDRIQTCVRSLILMRFHFHLFVFFLLLIFILVLIFVILIHHGWGPIDD